MIFVAVIYLIAKTLCGAMVEITSSVDRKATCKVKKKLVQLSKSAKIGLKGMQQQETQLKRYIQMVPIITVHSLFVTDHVIYLSYLSQYSTCKIPCELE